MAIFDTLKRISFLQVCIAMILFSSAGYAVNGNFYRYSVRHEKGTPPYFPFQSVERESVNSANGNLFFTVPLVSRAGRNGLGVDLKLAYNSKIWEHSGGYATLAERDSWIGPGWTLLIGRVIDDSANGYFYVTLSDGATHPLISYGGAWRSTDSTYMVYDPANALLRMKGGLTLLFNYVDPLDASIRYATRVRDTNGNYVDINYTGSGGRITNILDTVGGEYTFLLDANSRLQFIKYWNVNDTSQPTSVITLSHQSQSLVFGLGEATDPTSRLSIF